MSIEPDDKIAVMSGTGVISREQFDDFFSALGITDSAIDDEIARVSDEVKPSDEVEIFGAGQRRECVTVVTTSRGLNLHIPKITNPERDAWNAAVDAKKAAKKAAKGKK